MKKFIKRGLFFSLPFVLSSIVIMIVDPFNYFNLSGVIPNKIKIENSRLLNYCLWKALRYNEKPSENIFLGDSRVAGLDTKTVKEVSGLDFFDFAYGGGTIEEGINTFWFANSIVKLKNVYWGINFNVYNGYDIRDRVNGAVDMLRNPFLYIVNRNTVEATYHCTKAYMLNDYTSLEKPNISKAEFWKFKLSEAADRYFATYVYPQHYFQKLKEISDYCNKNDINLVFMIMPEHTDMQFLVSNYHLNSAYIKYIEDLKNLGEVYNFNIQNSVTSNGNNFNDPFHIKNDNLTYLIKQMWIGKYKDVNETLFLHYKF